MLWGAIKKESYQFLKKAGRLVSIVEEPDKNLAEQYRIQTFYNFVAPNGKDL
ncbi:MAG: hypothetical protein ACHQUC_05620 [Chlamydiales bacterium]